jgi:hypothetical protein
MSAGLIDYHMHTADSHLAENVGDLLFEGVQAIQRAGHYALTGFEKRKPFAIGW